MMIKKDRKREVCGEFPEFCYKAYRSEAHAKQFIEGAFRMNCRFYCREMEDESRRDTTEGNGYTLEPGIVTTGLVSPNPAEKTIWIKEQGYQKHHIDFGNATFLFCGSLPEVNAEYINKFGKYILKINDPRKLAEDINDHLFNIGQRFQIEGCRVIYNKGKKLDRKLSDNERLELPYKQKPEIFINDCEFRIVAIRFGEPCNHECKYLDGKFEPVEPECKFININLGKKLDYISWMSSQ